MSDWDFGPEVGDPLPTDSVWDRLDRVGADVRACEPIDDGPLWDRYLSDRAEHDAHAGDAPEESA